MAIGGSGKGIQIVVGTDYNDRDLKRAQRDLDRLKKEAAASATPMQKLGGTLQGFLGPALIGAAAAAGTFALKLGVDAVKAAMADEAAADKLAKTLQNVGAAHETARVEEYIFQLQKSTGIVDDEMRPAFERLVRSTENVHEAQRALSIALDVSASKGKPLQTVADALGKAYDGNTLSLGRLGLGLDSTILKSRDMGAITGELARLFRGQATAAAQTWEGRLTSLNVAFDELKESFGSGVLAGFSDGKGSIQDLTDALYEMRPAVEELGKSFGSLAQTLGENRDLIGYYTTAVQMNMALVTGAVDAAGFAWKAMIGVVTGSWPSDETERATKSASALAYQIGASGKGAAIMAQLVEQQARPAVLQLGAASAVATDEMSLLRAEIRRTTTRLGFLTSAFDAANAAMERREAMQGYREALKAYLEEPSGQTRDAVVQAMMDAALSFEDPSKQAEFTAKQVDKITAAAKAAGVQVPAWLANIGTAADNQLDPIASLKREMELIPTNIPVKITITTVGGKPPGVSWEEWYGNGATGGSVGSHNIRKGISRGVDSVPMLLAPGEFVVRKSAVDKFGAGLFSQLNRGINPLAGMTPMAGGRGGGVQVGTINVTSAAGERAEESVPRALRRMAFVAGLT